MLKVPPVNQPYGGGKLDVADAYATAVIYPDPGGGGYNPPVFMRHPNHLKFKGGYQGRGCLWGCLCDRDGRGNKRGQILT